MRIASWLRPTRPGGDRTPRRRNGARQSPGTRRSLMADPRGRVPGPDQRAHPGQGGRRVGHENADEQQATDDDADGLLIEVGQQQRPLQAGEDEYREDDAADRALAAE